jgi:fibronectin-binding autotransporter adhesin
MRPKLTFRQFLALAGSSLLAISSSHAANIWDGDGDPDNNWSNVLNWDNNALPGTGALTFTGDILTSTNNDLTAALLYAGLNFTNDGSSGKTSAFTLAGNSITLNGNITTTANTAGSTITDEISLGLILNNNRTITTNQLSDSVQHNLTISGIISETGGVRGITKAGGGVLTLSGENTYTGTTTVSGGTLRAGAAAGGQAFGNGGQVTLANTAGVTLDLNGFNQTIGNLSGGAASTISLGSGTLTTNQVSTGGLTHAGTITGTGGLVKDGVGTLTLNNAGNTFQGGVTISGGLLLVTADSHLGDAAGTITLNGGGLGIGTTLTSNRELILNNVAGNLVRVQGNQTWNQNGDITGDGGVIFRQNPNGGVSANLYGNNTFKGALGIEAGSGAMTVRLRSLADSATANGNIIYGLNTASNQAQTFEWDSAAGTALTVNNRAFEFAQDGTAFSTIRNSHATHAVTVNTNLVVSGSGTKTLTLDAVNGPRNAFNGNITDGSGTVALTKVGAGDWVLGGTNTYTGGTSVTAGGLVFLQTGSKSATGTHAFSGNTMLGLGVLGASGFTETDIINAFTGTMTGNLSDITVATNTHVGVDTTNGDFTLASNITTTGKQLHKLGDNTLTLTGTNSNNAVAIAKQGTLQYGTTASLSSSLPGRLSARDGATLAFNVGGTGEFTTANITTILNNQTTSSSLTNGMNAGSSIGFDTTNAGGTFTIGDVIGDTSGTFGGARGLTKLGTGSLELTNANTYTGNTLVSAGTLLVNNTSGSGTGTGDLTVAAGATLGGTGTVGGSTTIDGILSPGNSPGVLSFSNSLTLNSTAQTLIEIDGSSRGIEYDGVNVTGALTFNGALNLIFGTTFGASHLFNLFDFGSTSGEFTSISLAGSYTGSFTDAGSGVWTASTNSGNELWSFNHGTGDLILTVIPEPTTALLGLLGVLVFFRRRRKP